MGNTDSSQRLGERVKAAHAKFDREVLAQSQNCTYLQSISPQTLQTTIQSINESFQTYSPFSESVLILAWMYDAERCKNIILKSCKKVLNSPINRTEFQWFKHYVFESSVWFMPIPNKENRFMYHELLDIAFKMSEGIINSMNSIYEHLETHPKWSQMLQIKNRTLIARQDNDRVGLLKEEGIQDIFESKTDFDDEKAEDMKHFVDSNLGINILSSNAANVNEEFQHHVKFVMSHYGNVKPGPIKKVDRCKSKLENDYQSAEYPKSAKLLDLVRCSVTFNTVDQLINGYHSLMKHIQNNGDLIELARVKNGFLDKDTKGGYRDIKVNVVYKSQNPMHNGTKMICEIQLLIINYLQEKKRIHKLYSIQREAIYFEGVSNFKQGMESKSVNDIDVKELQFNTVLNVKEEVSLNYNIHNPSSYMMKSSVDSDLGLLGIEGINWFGVVDMKTKKPIHQMTRKSGTVGGDNHYGLQTHHWIKHKNKRLVSIQTSETQIEMFEVKTDKDNHKLVQDETYTVKSNTAIDFCEFDGTFENLLLVTDKNMLEMRSMANINTIVHSIKLEEAIVSDTLRNLRLSADGSICGLAGGDNKNYFYLIDIDKGKQYKLTSNVLYGTYVPCFINGQNNLVAVGDSMGMIEIWDVWRKEVVTTLSINSRNYIIALSSTNNVLAVFANDKNLRLYDVRNWKCFYTKECDFLPSSLHLTDDLKYVTLAGKMHQCIVLEIE